MAGAIKGRGAVKRSQLVLVVVSLLLELDGGHISQNGVQHLCSARQHCPDEVNICCKMSDTGESHLTMVGCHKQLHAFCLFCCTAFFISSSSFADSSASRLVVSPAFDEFCGGKLCGQRVV